MKKLQVILFSLLASTLYAQVTVSTITTEFKGSGGLSLDTDGNLYIGDFGDSLGVADSDGEPNNVLILDTNLDLDVYATGFLGASGNGFDSAGILHQSDIRDNAIFKIVDGVRTFVTSTGIVSPVGIVFDSNDNFFVCNCGDGTIRKVTPDGTSTEFASGDEFACPNGITVDENDNLYVSNFSNTNIVKITPDGTTSVLGNTPARNGHLDYDINSKKLYIASYAGQQILSLNVNTGVMDDVAGTGVRGNADGLASEATFSTPNGIAVSADGLSLFVNCAVPLNGDVINPQLIRKITGITLGVNDNDAAVISVTAYPNPTNNLVTLESKSTLDASNVTIEIHDIQGALIKKIERKNVSGTGLKETIDISDFSNGIYLYTIKSNKTSFASGKITKETP